MDALDAYLSDEDDTGTSPGFALTNFYEPIRHEKTNSNEMTLFKSRAIQTRHENAGVESAVNDVNVGPQNPYSYSMSSTKLALETAAIDDWSFHEQYKTFQRQGYAIDSSTNMVLGNYNAFISDGVSHHSASSKRQRISSLPESNEYIFNEDGPWAVEDKPIHQAQEEDISISPIREVTKAEAILESISESAMRDDVNAKNEFIIEPDEEEEKWEKVNERKLSLTLPPRPPRGSRAPEAYSTFHGTAEFDYQGRPWSSRPSSLKPSDSRHECFIPKKCIKKYTGHTKGVQGIEFSPQTGHLLLSGSLDGKCKIWDVYNDRSVLRTYAGHSEAVRSICFNKTGSHFLSSSFDRYMRLWDVETGQATGTFSNRKMAYDVKFYPNDNNIFLAACSDYKIHQWDARTGTICQEYNHHLQPVNAILFFDEGRKFVSSSDDKKLLVWEYDIPVPIKYIADPDMFSVPHMSLHPSGSFMAGQSMDNSIVVYSCGDSIKQVKKKTFKGHNNSGYSCQISFSPNGKYIISGDGFGKLNVWDWKAMKLYRKFQAHDNGPCIGAVWHPLNPSWIATCGWDGLIKLWD